MKSKQADESNHQWTTWRLRPGLEKKFSKGHPWVFSNDLDQSPKGIQAGAWIELRDARDSFLAFGYGNPSTLIAFRTLSRLPLEQGTDIRNQLVSLCLEKLKNAAELRRASAVDDMSHRLIFGEADGLPGVIVDRYLVLDAKNEPERQVFVIQCSTAGSDRLLPSLVDAIKHQVPVTPGLGLCFSGLGRKLPIAIVIAQDSSARAMEGLNKQDRVADGDWGGANPQSARIAVQGGEAATSHSPLSWNPRAAAIYEVNFVDGQKTGFFLDQRLNVRLAWPLFIRSALRAREQNHAFRLLDLFCYVGQWSVQAARAAAFVGAKAEVYLADASTQALELAKRNVESAGASADTRKMDVMQDIGSLPIGAYDVVICDPPAFIKKKKDHPTGRAAYFKLNREAIKRVAPGGVFVSCSCSGLFTEEEFAEMLSDATRASGREVVWVSRGGHGEDHPYRSEFPQGRYLKGWIGVVT